MRKDGIKTGGERKLQKKYTHCSSRWEKSATTVSRGGENGSNLETQTKKQGGGKITQKNPQKPPQKNQKGGEGKKRGQEPLREVTKPKKGTWELTPVCQERKKRIRTDKNQTKREGGENWVF